LIEIEQEAIAGIASLSQSPGIGREEIEVAMKVKIVTFPETRVASITHLGPPGQEHDTARKLIDWKIKNRLLDQSKYRSYGLHYTDPRALDPLKHRVDFCLSIDGAVDQNDAGIVEKVIPVLKCAFARDVGSRMNNQAAKYLIEEWLPKSGEELSGFPLIFHYVNVGPDVREHEAITDVYLPLK
jgi:AraC family transcriptional regulator